MTREQFMNMEDFFLSADPRIMIEWREIGCDELWVTDNGFTELITLHDQNNNW